MVHMRTYQTPHKPERGTEQQNARIGLPTKAAPWFNLGETSRVRGLDQVAALPLAGPEFCLST